MYTGLLHTHNLFRWLILLTLVIALILYYSGWLGNKKWLKRDNIVGLLLTIFVDFQFVIGILLYAFYSPITKSVFANFGAAMKNSDLRFYAVEHILIMLIALVLTHVGRVKAKKALLPVKKHKLHAIFFTIVLILFLIAIPWSRPFV